jgi:hypothetical protein
MKLTSGNKVFRAKHGWFYKWIYEDGSVANETDQKEADEKWNSISPEEQKKYIV